MPRESPERHRALLRDAEDLLGADRHLEGLVVGELEGRALALEDVVRARVGHRLAELDRRLGGHQLVGLDVGRLELVDVQAAVDHRATGREIQEGLPVATLCTATNREVVVLAARRHCPADLTRVFGRVVGLSVEAEDHGAVAVVGECHTGLADRSTDRDSRTANIETPLRLGNAEAEVAVRHKGQELALGQLRSGRVLRPRGGTERQLAERHLFDEAGRGTSTSTDAWPASAASSSSLGLASAWRKPSNLTFPCTSKRPRWPPRCRRPSP